MRLRFVSGRVGHGRSSGRAAIFRLFAVLVACSLAVGVSAIGATASTARRRAETPVQKGLAFYRGKTIVVIDSGTVGGPYDLYARVLMPYIAQYLHASYEVENVSAADGVPGMNQAASAPPTGLTAGVFQQFTSISHLVAGVKGLNFNVERLAWIAGDGLSTQVLASSASSGIANIAQLLAKDRSGSTPPSMILGANGALDSAIPQAVLGILGLRIHFLVGYPTVSLEASGLERGDAPLTFLPSSIIGPLISGGQAKPLVISGKIPPGTLYRSIESPAPTIAELFKKYPPKTKVQREQAAAIDAITSLPSGLLALQTGVASYKIAAMRAAATWAERQPQFRSKMLSYSLNPTVYNPVAAKGAFIKSIKEGASLGCYLSGTC